MNKDDIRKVKLKERDLLSNEEVEEASILICRKIIESSAFADNEIILLYAAYHNEVDLDYLFNYAKNNNKKVAFPKSYIVDNKSLMDFYFIDGLHQLTKGYKGILEPDILLYELEKVEVDKALCIVPGLAFDYDLMRVGYGKGFYDNYLKLHRNIFTIGVCYDFQIVDKIDTFENDIAVNMIISDKNCIKKEDK